MIAMNASELQTGYIQFRNTYLINILKRSHLENVTGLKGLLIINNKIIECFRYFKFI